MMTQTGLLEARMEEITQSVCNQLQVERDLLQAGRGRQADILIARYIATHLIRAEMSFVTLKMISRFFGSTSKTFARDGLDRLHSIMEVNSYIRRLVDSLELLLITERKTTV